LKCTYKATVFDVTFAEMEEIPKELIISWDHMGWTMAKEGSKMVEMLWMEISDRSVVKDHMSLKPKVL
jgi:hypothetical protein